MLLASGGGGGTGSDSLAPKLSKGGSFDIEPMAPWCIEEGKNTTKWFLKDF